MAEPKEVQMIFTTEKIEEIKNKVDQGYKITRQEKYWAENYVLTKRDGIVFTLSKEEQDEYFKCKLGVDINNKPFLGVYGQVLKQSGIQYFAEQYCKVKNELGQVKNIKLRDYQNDILNMFMDNRFSILCSSRQSGKCFSPMTYVNINNNEIKVYHIWFKSIKKKTFLDYVKYNIYKIIDYFE
jgi:hypothetical protein